MTRLIRIPGRVLLVTVAIAALFGCNRSSQSPQERAYDLFAHSEFEAALQACNEAQGLTVQPQELADLYLLRGRCLLGQADQLQNTKQDDLATEKLNEAVVAFTHSLDVMKGAAAHYYYYRSLAYEMMGDEERALEDGKIARELDKTYPMAYINEPVEELIAVPPARQGTDESVDPNAQASADRSSMGVTDETGMGDGGLDGTGSAKDESEEAARGAASVVTRGRAAGGSALQRQMPGNLTSKSDPAGSTDYRGQPASPGEWSTAVPRTPAGISTRPGDLTAGRGLPTGRTPAAQFGPTDASARPGSQAEEAEEEDLADDSSDAPPSEENLPAEPTESPRPRAIWPPLGGPWSVTPQPPGTSLPTTGLGGAPAWGTMPYSAGAPMQQAPTTGIVGPPVMRNPWNGAWGPSGGSANPFALPSTGIGGSRWPTTPFAPSTPFAPVPTGPTMTPAPQPGVGLQQPMMGPAPMQSLPTTGVQRTVSPYSVPP